MRIMARLLPLIVTGLVIAGCVAPPPPQPRHPYYLHALSDLRAARWLLEHRPGNTWVEHQEEFAVSRINEAIAEIRQASIDDGQNLNYHPPVDVPPEGAGRLHRAEEILRQVYADIAREEDDPTTIGLRDRAIHHVDEAIRATHRAIENVRR